MGLIVLVAWIVALVVAFVVLGFCGYEIAWKSRRLRQDVAGMHELDEHLVGLREHLTVTQARITAAKIGQ